MSKKQWREAHEIFRLCGRLSVRLPFCRPSVLCNPPMHADLTSIQNMVQLTGRRVHGYTDTTHIQYRILLCLKYK